MDSAPAFWLGSFGVLTRRFGLTCKQDELQWKMGYVYVVDMHVVQDRNTFPRHHQAASAVDMNITHVHTASHVHPAQCQDKQKVLLFDCCSHHMPHTAFWVFDA